MTGIKDLAEYLDISIGTVSRALNGKPDVSDDTRRRVMEAAEKLGYVANQSGRALRKGSTGVIGFMMQTGREISGQGGVFFMDVFDGVQSVLARHGLDLVALLCSSNEDPDAYLKRVVARGFADGFILSATRRIDPRFELLSKHSIPFISLGRSQTDAGQPWLDLDFEGMAITAMERFVARGHRHVGVFWPKGDLNLGYVLIDQCRKTLAQHGLILDDQHIFRATPDEAGGYQVARSIMECETRPTAILLVNEAFVTGLYRGLEEVGLNPGKEIEIIGRYNPQARYLSPSLTCFNLSLRDLGVSLAESLLATMPDYAQSYPDAAWRKLWPLDLVEGESG